jgi:hypothetical protein
MKKSHTLPVWLSKITEFEVAEKTQQRCAAVEKTNKYELTAPQ